jgi:hypothetical protein
MVIIAVAAVEKTGVACFQSTVQANSRTGGHIAHPNAVYTGSPTQSSI